MALKALRIRRSIDSKNELLHQLMEKDESFRTRETELEAAIMEAKTDDDLATVDQEVEKFEGEKSANENEKQRLAKEIEGLEANLKKLEEETPAPAASSNPPKERKDSMNLKDIKIRSLPMQVRVFDALTHEQRSAIVARDDVKEFLSRLRSMKGQTRDVSGA